MTDSEPDAFAPGTTLGYHRLERLLGRGGMGAVFLAYDTRLHRQVAVKVIDTDTDDGTSSAQLLREARNVAALNHPNICSIYEVGESGGTAFIAMEYVSGRSLRDRIDGGAVPVDEALRLGIQAADALSYAHDHGVVHRDFKAANVIVGDGGRLKIVDFGLARRDDSRLAEATTLPSAVVAGAVAGTPYSMAPEQVRGHVADARADIWALGVLLYEMVAGAKPFSAPTVPELFSAILTEPPTSVPSRVPTGLCTVIERCLDKDPARRYQRAGDVRSALESVAAGTSTPWAAWAYHVRRRPGVALAVAVAIIGGVLTGFNVSGLRDRLIGVPPRDAPIRLAVLPFQNLTGDPEQEYFSDGLTDEMIGQLARLHPERLSVIARTSSMRYKRRDMPLDQIAGELGVDYVMEGSARREGSRIRISATLIDARDQTQRWSETFERELASVLALQSDVARGVARALAITLLPSSQSRLAAARQVDPDAYEAYLKGRFYWQSVGGAKGLDAAMSHFERAVQEDPGFATPYTGMGTVWGLRCTGGLMSCREALPKWREAVLKAKERDPDLPEVQAHLAAMAFYVDWDWVAAAREFDRAMSLDPTSLDARMWYTDFLQSVGRLDEAVAEGRRIVESDPQNTFYRALFGRTLIFARRDDEAIAVLQDVLKADPTRRNAQVQLQQVFARKGMYDDAWAMMQRLAEDNRTLAEALNRAYAEGGFRRAARVRADWAAQRLPDACGVAGFYARAEEKELTLDWLEKGYEQGCTSMVHLRVDPLWAHLRGEPRYQDLLTRLKFQN